MRGHTWGAKNGQALSQNMVVRSHHYPLFSSKYDRHRELRAVESCYLPKITADLVGLWFVGMFKTRACQRPSKRANRRLQPHQLPGKGEDIPASPRSHTEGQKGSGERERERYTRTRNFPARDGTPQETDISERMPSQQDTVFTPRGPLPYEDMNKTEKKRGNKRSTVRTHTHFHEQRTEISHTR